MILRCSRTEYPFEYEIVSRSSPLRARSKRRENALVTQNHTVFTQYPCALRAHARELNSVHSAAHSACEPPAAGGIGGGRPDRDALAGNLGRPINGGRVLGESCRARLPTDDHGRRGAATDRAAEDRIDGTSVATYTAPKKVAWASTPPVRPPAMKRAERRTTTIGYFRQANRTRPHGRAVPSPRSSWSLVQLAAGMTRNKGPR